MDPTLKQEEKEPNDTMRELEEKHEVQIVHPNGLNINRVYWAIGAQVLFAIFLIIAYFAIGYEVKPFVAQHMGDIIPGWNANQTVIKLNELSQFKLIDGSFQTSYNLSITAIVFAFVGILIPCSSLIFRNDSDSKWINYSMLLWDAIALILAIAGSSIVLYQLTITDGNALLAKIAEALGYGGKSAGLADTAKSLLGNSDLAYKSGKAAGMFIMIFAGYGIALAGNIYAYKNYFKIVF